MQYTFEVIETVASQRWYTVNADNEDDARELAENGETIDGGELTLREIGVVAREVGELMDAGEGDLPLTIKLGSLGLTIVVQGGGGKLHGTLGAGMDAIESMLLAHAVAGIAVDSPAYLEGLETAIDAIGNHD